MKIMMTRTMVVMKVMSRPIEVSDYKVFARSPPPEEGQKGALRQRYFFNFTDICKLLHSCILLSFHCNRKNTANIIGFLWFEKHLVEVTHHAQLWTNASSTNWRTSYQLPTSHSSDVVVASNVVVVVLLVAEVLAILVVVVVVVLVVVVVVHHRW